jgi:hypothetical protein
MGQHAEFLATRCKAEKMGCLEMNGLDSKSAGLRPLGDRLPLPAPRLSVKRERIVGLGYCTLERA